MTTLTLRVNFLKILISVTAAFVYLSPTRILAGPESFAFSSFEPREGAENTEFQNVALDLAAFHLQVLEIEAIRIIAALEEEVDLNLNSADADDDNNGKEKEKGKEKEDEASVTHSRHNGVQIRKKSDRRAPSKLAPPKKRRRVCNEKPKKTVVRDQLKNKIIKHTREHPESYIAEIAVDLRLKFHQVFDILIKHINSANFKSGDLELVAINQALIQYTREHPESDISEIAVDLRLKFHQVLDILIEHINSDNYSLSDPQLAAINQALIQSSKQNIVKQTRKRRAAQGRSALRRTKPEDWIAARAEGNPEAELKQALRREIVEAARANPEATREILAERLKYSVQLITIMLNDHLKSEAFVISDLKLMVYKDFNA